MTTSVDIYTTVVFFKSSAVDKTTFFCINLSILCSVAEPELKPVEQQHFAGAGAKVFFGPAPAPEPGM
jgi:hypothetical protein